MFWVIGGMLGVGLGTLELTNVTIVIDAAATPRHRLAATVLAEEVGRRTGIPWTLAHAPPAAGPVVRLVRNPPVSNRIGNEGYQIETGRSSAGAAEIVVTATSDRGLLFGVGHLLRSLDLRPGKATLARPLTVAAMPRYSLRGHQLGYRARANSYDAWTAEAFDQYIRELALFGANAIENIPFEDRRQSPHMKLTRKEMNVRLSQICDRYDLEYWVWTPADFDLADDALRRESLAAHEVLYEACPRLDAVFVPGGDPGDNHPDQVMPFLADLADRLWRRHPHAKVWLSMQGYNAGKVDAVFAYLEAHQPKWFGGIVAGPSSPPIAATRQRLGSQYRLRHYPDITHCVRCQYPIWWWDPAFAWTLGREPPNPTPRYQAAIHNAFAPDTTGFLTYSDGIHDDVNKIVWTRLGWDPASDLREVLVEYSRFFFGAEVAERAADGILALERNWTGPLRENGGVDATLALWTELEKALPKPASGWRWDLCRLRAAYDAYTRHRLLYEERLEAEALAALAKPQERPGKGGAAEERAAVRRAVETARGALRRAETERVRPELRAKIVGLCDDLYRSIGLQTSVERHQASGRERGCILDFLDHPLNQRWWLEDELDKILQMSSVTEAWRRLDVLRRWEDPGPGSFYDDIGNVAKSPHVVRPRSWEGPRLEREPNTSFLWWEEGRTRQRSSWVSYMDWPAAIVYEHLDPKGTYLVRTTGLRECWLRIDGERVTPTKDGRDVGTFKEFPVPAAALADGKLILTFDVPSEPELNWRVRSRLTEIWLLKQPLP